MAQAEDFFASVDSIGIAQRHADQVLKLEEQQASRLLRRYKEVRQDLRDRLDAIRGDTFTAQQLRGVLLQIELAIQAMTESLQRGMNESAQTIAEKSIEDLTKEIRRFEQEFRGAVSPLALNATLIATDVNNFKLNQYQSSLQAYGQAVVSDLTRVLSDAVLMNQSLGQVVQGLGRYFQAEEWKLLRIARTELHGVYAAGKLEGMQQAERTAIPGLKKALYHPMDARTAEDSKALAVENPILPIDEPFKYKWNGQERVFMAPPDRPNDRAILIPAHDDWVESASASAA